MNKPQNVCMNVTDQRLFSAPDVKPENELVLCVIALMS